MKIYFNSIKDNETFSVPIDPETFKKLNYSNNIASFDGGNYICHASRVDKILTLDFEIEANLTLISDYSFKKFKDTYQIEDTLYYTNDKSYESVEVFYEKGPIDLDEIVYSLVITNLPLVIKMEGEELPSGDSYRVLDEETYLKEKRESHSNFEGDFDDRDDDEKVSK